MHFIIFHLLLLHFIFTVSCKTFFNRHEKSDIEEFVKKLIMKKTETYNTSKTITSCKYRCWNNFGPENPCQCDSKCEEHGNCCDDFEKFCFGGLAPKEIRG